jgi:hypothetical protein
MLEGTRFQEARNKSAKEDVATKQEDKVDHSRDSLDFCLYCMDVNLSWI